MQQETQNPYEAYLDRKAAADRLAAAFRKETEQKYGSTRNYHKNLLVDVITRGDDPLLDDFYKLYEKLFAADGAIPKFRFARALDRNSDTPLQERSGPFRYELAIIRDPDTKEILAGTSYVAIASKDKKLDDYYHGTVAGNYTFVDSKARSLGLSYRLQELRLEQARKFFGAVRSEAPEAMRALIFNEHNNPLAMTPKAYLADMKDSLIEQFNRMAYWQNRGYRRLPFDFIEPPGLFCEHPVTDMCLNVCSEHEIMRTRKGEALPPEKISAETIIFHLRGFYSACHLGKQPPETDAVFRQQKAELTNRKDLIPCDDRDQIKAMEPLVTKELQRMTSAEAAREARTVGEIFGLSWSNPSHAPEAPLAPLPPRGNPLRRAVSRLKR